jgi:hypothetical protein
VQLWVKGRAADQIAISAAWVLPDLSFIAFTAREIIVLGDCYMSGFYMSVCTVFVITGALIVAASCALRVCEVCTFGKGALLGGPEAVRTTAGASAP